MIQNSVEFKIGKLIVGNGTKLENANVGVKNGIIKEISTNRLKGEFNETIELTNKIVIPGLIDAHCHIKNGPKPEEIKPSDEYMAIRGMENARKALMAGVTSLGEAGANRNQTFSVRNAINDGITLGPRLFVSGSFISMTGGIARKPGEELYEVSGADEARKAARALLMYYGADFIKLEATGAINYIHTSPWTIQLTIDEMRPPCEEAHKLGKKVHAHTYGEKGTQNCIEAGVDAIVHGQGTTEKQFNIMKERDLFFLPTLKVFCGHMENIDQEWFGHKKIATTGVWEQTEPTFRNAVKSGVMIAMGSDAGDPDNLFGDNPKDLEYMVKWGMTPDQAIIAGTLNAAKSLAVDNIIGTVEEGKYADMVVLKKDPLKDISRLRTSLEHVILNGQIIN
ncbi:amidohydrolase family protein [Thermoproteota archaeon]